MSETLTIKRKDGDVKPHAVTSGNVSVAFEGDGPWQVSAEDWSAISWTACDWFEVAPIESKSKKPAPVAVKE